MITLFKQFSLFALSILVFSCKKNLDVSIQSLNKSGEEFYFGEQVPVWVSGNSQNFETTYEWSATGGAFSGWRTQNLFENLWIAPDSAGEYTVTATAKAKSGNGSSTKSANMRVTRYYFDEFQSAYTLNGNGWSTSNTKNVLITDNDTAKSRLELSATSSSAPYVRRTLDLAELKIPFSIRTRLGWKDYFKSGQAITISLYFRQPSNASYPYIREIRWEIFPNVNPQTTNNYQLRYETYVPATNVSKFSAVGNAVPNPLPLINPVTGKRADHSLADGQLRNFSFSLDANNIFYAYVDGVLWFTSTGIKDWLSYASSTYPGFEQPVGKEYRVTFPAKESNKSGSTLVMKHVYINNDGQILK